MYKMLLSNIHARKLESIQISSNQQSISLNLLSPMPTQSTKITLNQLLYNINQLLYNSSKYKYKLAVSLQIKWKM